MRRNFYEEKFFDGTLARNFLVFVGNFASAAENSVAPAETIKISQLSETWDKVFPENKNVDHRKIIFLNRFGITLVGDLYTPKNFSGKLPVIAIAFDTSFTGEGEPRNTTSPDINTEDFS